MVHQLTRADWQRMPGLSATSSLWCILPLHQTSMSFWGLLKHHIGKQPRRPITLDDLFELAERIWERDITQEMVNKQVEKMQDRVGEVKRRKGAATMY